MANAVYPKAKEAMLTGDVDLIAETVRLQMFDDDVVYDATDEFLDDVAGTALGAAVEITAKDVTNGQFTGTNGSFTPTAGATVSALVVFIDSGSEATSRVLAYLDTKGDTAPIAIVTTGDPMLLHWTDPYLSIGG
jgi:hypothetical protein